MNKKDYIKLAEIIKSSVGNYLKQDNEKFDEKKFRSYAEPLKN